MKQIGQECTDATSIRVPSRSHNHEPPPPRIRRRTCRTYSFSPISKVAPFFLKWFMVELGHVQKLVELMSSFFLFVCCSRFRVQLIAIYCSRWGCVDSTPHTSLFLMQWTRTHCCTSHCMAQKCVGARHVIYMVIHVVRLDCWFSLYSSLCSLPCVSPSSTTWTLTCTLTSSKWTSSGQYPTGTPPTEESGPLANKTPLTGYEPNILDDFHYSETTEIFFQEQSSDTMPSYLQAERMEQGGLVSGGTIVVWRANVHLFWWRVRAVPAGPRSICHRRRNQSVEQGGEEPEQVH